MPDVAAQERLVDDGSGQKQVRRRLLLKSNVIDADVKKNSTCLRMLQSGCNIHTEIIEITLQ